MREIKFRVWDGNNEKYDYPEILELHKGIEYEQFTGLHDKNGKEIYEGDIVLWNGIVCEIRYREDIAAFERFYNLGPAILSNRHKPLMEVIGNIHDNPELLK